MGFIYTVFLLSFFYILAFGFIVLKKSNNRCIFIFSIDKLERYLKRITSLKIWLYFSNSLLMFLILFYKNFLLKLL